MNTNEIMALDADALRLAIAEAKGWTYERETITSPTRDGKIFTHEIKFWKHSEKKFSTPPDWPGDIAAAWELVEEMREAGWFVSVTTDPPGYSCYTAKLAGDNIRLETENTETADTAARAIAKAWLLWKAGE